MRLTETAWQLLISYFIVITYIGFVGGRNVHEKRSAASFRNQVASAATVPFDEGGSAACGRDILAKLWSGVADLPTGSEGTSVATAAAASGDGFVRHRPDARITAGRHFLKRDEPFRHWNELWREVRGSGNHGTRQL
jgi:hypothetical protein